MELNISTPEAMMELGAQIAQLCQEGDVIYLSGELGLGKTTLAKGIGRGLGCRDNITSPTFTLMNIYPGRLTLYHCDFYRLSGEDAEQLGIKDLIGIEGLFVIEWAGTVSPELLPPGLNISFELAEDDYEGPRKVTLSAASERAGRIIKELESCRS